jgi:ribosomal protein S18 acetylase RimI-like enzyme
MDYQIRKLCFDDYQKIIELWQLSGLSFRPLGRDSKENMSKEFELEQTAFLGMFGNEKLIGVVLTSSDGRKGWINRLAVHPDYKGRGLAGKLIEASEEFLQSLGIKVIAALIEGDNKESFRTFAKSGYEIYEGVKYLSKRSSLDD